MSSKESGVFGVLKLKENLCKIVSIINTCASTLPTSLEPSTLVGKSISHFYNDSGIEEWWEGKITSYKDGRFVLKYDNNPDDWILSKDDVMHDINVGDIILY